MAGRVTPLWQAFNAGELTPLLDGRTDQEKYFAGAKTLQNMRPLVQGPARRRGGSKYLGTTKSNGQAWFTPFEFSADQSYLIELGDLYARFWVNRGQLLSSGTPYEITTPWSSANLETAVGTFSLRTEQSGDTMWVTHATGAVAPQKLVRSGATSWAVSAVAFLDGPFDDINPENATTVYASASTGTVTLTASTAIFQAHHVGTAFYLESEDPDSVDPWETAKSVFANVRRRYQGNVYEATTTATTGTVPPTHLYGESKDGDTGVKWEYRHSGWGICTITAVGGGGTTATATVRATDGRRQIPAEVVGSGNATRRWAFGAFNSNAGWPTNVSFFRGRLCFSRGRTVFLSAVGEFDNFLRQDGPDITAATSMVITVSADRTDSFTWMEQSEDLILGNPRSEIIIKEETPNQVFAADNVRASPQTEYGSFNLRPLRVGNAVLFAQRGGKRIRELRYSFDINRYVAEDLNILGEHIFESKIQDWDFALEPDSSVYCVKENGTLGVFTYDRERGVLAWSNDVLGGDGIVETVGVLPSPNQDRDDVWVVVRRTVNGSTVRYVEYFETATPSALADAIFVDSAITYSGAATTSITGLSHLEGATVSVLADGSPHADVTVTGGAITLTRAVTKAQIGFKYTSILQTMRPDGGFNDGTGQTRTKAVAEVSFRLQDTLGGKVGPSLTVLQGLKYLSPRATVGSPPTLFSGDIAVSWPRGYETDGYVFFVQDQPLPATVVAIAPTIETSD